MRYEVKAEVWLYAGDKAAWHFLSLPPDMSEGIRRLRGPRVGWGSLRVAATVGGTTWRTSIFPDSRSGAFILPIKADVRRRENIAAGDRVTVNVDIEF